MSQEPKPKACPFFTKKRGIIKYQRHHQDETRNSVPNDLLKTCHKSHLWPGCRFLPIAISSSLSP